MDPFYSFLIGFLAGFFTVLWIASTGGKSVSGLNETDVDPPRHQIDDAIVAVITDHGTTDIDDVAAFVDARRPGRIAVHPDLMSTIAERHLHIASRFTEITHPDHPSAAREVCSE